MGDKNPKKQLKKKKEVEKTSAAQPTLKSLPETAKKPAKPTDKKG